MSFAILPAIDVHQGRLAVYTPQGPRAVEAFGGDPLGAADAFVGAGARRLHVVDMTLAFQGVPGNVEVVSRIHRRLPDVSIQAGGGITTWERAADYLEAGADRFVLGAAALGDAAATERVLDRAGVRAIVGIEVDGGQIRARGEGEVELDLIPTLGWLTALGVPGFLVTNISRVGGLAGPDVGLVLRVARTGRPTVAAGGIASLEDLRAVRDAGAVGAVVGRAALEGQLDLLAAMEWAAA